MIFDYFKKFFKNQSVRFASIFPKSCFKIENQLNSFEIQTKIKGKFRKIVIPGIEYDNFWDSISAVAPFFDNLSSLPFLIKKNNFLSFTDIYSIDNLEPIIKGDITYSNFTYNQWSQFINQLKLHIKAFKYCSYIDIADFYKNIYLHFVNGLCTKSIDEFKEVEQRQGKFYKQYAQNYSWLFKFEKILRNKICIFGQTCGIPIGNGLSDFVSELILLWIENIVSSEHSNFTFKCIRYRDDIYIFSNSKTDINTINFAFKSALSFIKINHNLSKSIDFIECSKNDFSSRWYADEEKYKNELLKSCTDSSMLEAFASRYPESNKIYSLFKKCLFDTTLDNNLLGNLINVFNKSQTNVIPWIITIIDKRLSKKSYLDFVQAINPRILTESDKIWLWCYEKKWKINSILTNELNKTITEKHLSGCFSDEEINFYKDINTFSY